MKKIHLYLAHPIVEREKIRKWELEMEEKYPILLANPFYDSKSEGERKAIRILDRGGKVTYDKKLVRDIVKKDLHAIEVNEGTLAFVSKSPSIGTIMEICYSHLKNKPTFVVAEQDSVSKEFPIAAHPWIQYHATQVFHGFDEFETFVKDGELERIIRGGK